MTASAVTRPRLVSSVPSPASGQPSRLLWAVWIQWAALTIVVATAAAYALAFFLPNLEAAQLTFAVGMGWSSLTPPVLRAIRRRIRG